MTRVISRVLVWRLMSLKAYGEKHTSCRVCVCVCVCMYLQSLCSVPMYVCVCVYVFVCEMHFFLTCVDALNHKVSYTTIAKALE